MEGAFVPATAFLPARGTSATSCCERPSVRVAPMTMADEQGNKKSKSRRFKPGKGAGVKKVKLEPETVFVETGPSWTELVVPTLSLLTVIGIIPFTAAVARATWVRYKITNRRISISSGFQGKDQTEIIYRDIEGIKYVRRIGGAGDCVISLKDGAKLEVRAIPDFQNVFDYILDKLDDEARAESGSA